MTFAVDAILGRQEQMITRQQALEHLTQDEVLARLGRRWLVVLPGIYAASTAAITHRQRLRAALLHAGPDSMLSDLDALAAHRIPFLPADPFVRVLVPDAVQRSSRDFVVVRRTTRLPRAVNVAGHPVAPAYRAVCEFVLRHPDHREALAVAAASVQLSKVSLPELVEEAHRGPARGRPRLMRVIEALEAGVRSAPEEDFRQLVRRSPVLPEPLWNCLLLMPDGRKISPDALFVDAGLVHETNGRRYHSAQDAGEDAFEDMQRRHDALVTADLTVLHNSPGRISTEGRAVIAEVERCHARLAGRGLPPGVVILQTGPPGVPRDAPLRGLSA